MPGNASCTFWVVAGSKPSFLVAGWLHSDGQLKAATVISGAWWVKNRGRCLLFPIQHSRNFWGRKDTTWPPWNAVVSLCLVAKHVSSTRLWALWEHRFIYACIPSFYRIVPSTELIKYLWMSKLKNGNSEKLFQKNQKWEEYCNLPYEFSKFTYHLWASYSLSTEQAW